MSMAALPKFDDAVLEQICACLGDTSFGFTGSEIARLLAACGIEDPSPTMTKRHRLHDALSQRQAQDGAGNSVARFIIEAMKPARYVGQSQTFDARRAELNEALAFAGLELGEDGQLTKGKTASTLSEVEQRARRLKAELLRRNVHPDALRFCKAELLDDNYFHAVLEASKSVAEKIREKSGLTTDGSELVDVAFSVKNPVLAFNTLQTPTERSEQTGLANLMKGMFSAFRNPTAHAPKVNWDVTEQDAADLMALVSLLHRRLDAAVKTRP